MGCRKLSYYEGGSLGKTDVFLGVPYEKSVTAEKIDTDYYPFGSVARRVNTPNSYFENVGTPIDVEDDSDFGQYYRYGFQGEFAEEDSETGWNSFELRMYDPVIGRFLVPDPMKEFASPYVGMGNDPVNFTDPTGGTTHPVKKRISGFKNPNNFLKRAFNTLTGNQFLNDAFKFAQSHPGALMHYTQGENGIDGAYAIYASGMTVEGEAVFSGIGFGSQEFVDFTSFAEGDMIPFDPVALGAVRQVPMKLAARIARKNSGLFRCVQCADEIVSAFRKKGFSGEVVTLNTSSTRGNIAGNIWSDTQQKLISTNGVHKGILIDGKVFDNLNPNGLDYQKWLNDFHSPSGITVTKTSF